MNDYWSNYIDNDYSIERDHYAPGAWLSACTVSLGDYLVIWSDIHLSTVVLIDKVEMFDNSRGTFFTTTDLRNGRLRHFYFKYDYPVFIAWPREFDDEEKRNWTNHIASDELL